MTESGLAPPTRSIGPTASAEVRESRASALGSQAEATFHSLYEVHQPGLLRWLRARMRDDAAAEDCCQEAFARLLAELRSGRAPDVPGAWLHHVAHNLLISGVRHARVGSRRGGHPVAPTALDPTAAAIVERERWQELHRALHSMPDEERTLLVLAACGRSGAQLADRLGVTPTAARMRLHRARQRLRAQLQPLDVAESWLGTDAR